MTETDQTNEPRLGIDLPRKPVPVALGFALLNWLIPGAGYVAAKDYVRGSLLFLLINGIFAVGLFAFDGYVFVPSFEWGSVDFNIVMILMFIVQCFHGSGMGILLLLAESNSALAGLLIRDPGASLSDLGAFHILVAGGLNYFASVKLFDDLVGWVDPEPRKGEEKSTQKPENDENSTAETTPENDDDVIDNDKEAVRS